MSLSPAGKETIDFSDPEAVFALNKALLLKYYDLSYYDIPDGYLCPPVPGRSDYIHHIADALAEVGGKKPYSKEFVCLDIGTGADLIYPIIGTKCYGWNFIGTDIDDVAISNANKILVKNEILKGRIELRKQKSPNHLFRNIWKKDEYIDLVVCNPPFYTSRRDADKATTRKNRNLKKSHKGSKQRNFHGQPQELWFPGGEKAFISKMIKESISHGNQCFLFSSLISKDKSLPALKALLSQSKVKHSSIIEMAVGNKVTRLLTWSFLTEKQRKIWAQSRWR